MADNEKEIIKKIEAKALEAKPIVPEVLSSKRSAFLNKAPFSNVECLDTPQTETQLSQIGIATHCWSICNLHSITAGQGYTSMWVQGPYVPNTAYPSGITFPINSASYSYGGFAFKTNPLNPSWTGNWSAQVGPPEYNAFYDWVVSQVGNVNVGDTITFDMSMNTNGSSPWGGYGFCNLLNVPFVNKVCFKYEGQFPFGGFPYIGGFNNTLNAPANYMPTVLRDDCCNNTTVSLCYNIGDIGPEGGIIFSVPGVGLNTSTNVYYEVAQNDIAEAATPSNYFNTTCGDIQYVQLSYVARGLAIIADDNILVDTSLPTNSQFLNDLTSGVISVGTIVNTALTPNSQLMFPTTVAGIGEPIVAINYLPNQIIELVFNSVILNAYNPPLTTGISFWQVIDPGFGTQGAEFGAHNIRSSGPPPTIQTSMDFGLGIDNTDIIDAFPGNPGTPTGGTHPWLNTREIAATICKNYGTTSDWFLPSVQEFKEMFTNVGPGSSAANQITFNPLTQKSEHLYWTSSQHIDNGTGLQDPDKYAYAYDTIANNTKLAYRCHPLSVRPIRRFECEIPVDEGITYDWRFSFRSQATPGGIELIEPNIQQFTIGTYSVPKSSVLSESSYPTHHSGNQNPPSWMPASSIVFPQPALNLSNWNGPDLNYAYGNPPVGGWAIGVDPNDLINVTPPTVGMTLNAPHDTLGPITDIVNWTPTVNVSSVSPSGFIAGTTYEVWVFNNAPYIPTPNLPGLTQVLSWDIQITHPLYSPCLNPGACYEIGHPSLEIAFARWDTVGNDIKSILCSCVTANGLAPEFQNEPFNIKIYSQYEELLGDYDYKIVGTGGCCSTCAATKCKFSLDMRLVSVNFVEPTLQNPINPNILNTANYWGEDAGGAGNVEGNAYLAFTHATHPAFTSLTRGNTLNLMNWRGTGINNRALLPSNPFYTGVSPDWNSSYNRFGWGVVCGSCGTTSNGCYGTGLREYLGEVNYTSAVNACSNYPAFGYSFYYPSYAFQSYASPNAGLMTGQGWVDGNNDTHSPCYSILDATGGALAKISAPSENYPEEINKCFEEGEKEFNIYIAPQEQYDLNMSARQKFINDKKPKETGPFGIAGYYPLYDTIDGAIINSPTPVESRSGEDTYGYHIHEFEGTEYYMPNGLEMGVTQFHGDYDGQIIPETIVEPEVTEDIPETIETPDIPTVISPPIITELEEEPDTEPTYIPPPPPSSSGGGGGGY